MGITKAFNVLVLLLCVPLGISAGYRGDTLDLILLVGLATSQLHIMDLKNGRG